MNQIKKQKRTNYCGALSSKNEGQTVTLMGWVDTRRDHGGLVFIDLRDREGMVQVVLDPSQEKTADSKQFRNEYVVVINGEVRLRPDGMKNDKIPTGEIEVVANECTILSAAEPLPIQVSDSSVSESLRLKYRYLDLRSSLLQSHLKLRHEMNQELRNFLNEHGFWEVETPILYKSTPEGARDYLVPSRVHQGQFYALPQSPQTLKQLLMVGGTDRYFQIARCFRDEDLRADRQPEFTQLDLEMSFVDEEDIFALNESLLARVWKRFKGVEITNVPRMSYHEAMNRFGSDKPDLRLKWEMVDLTEGLKECGFKVFEDTAQTGGAIKSLFVPGGGSFSRGQMDKLTKKAKEAGAKGLVWIKSSETGELTSPIKKFFSEEAFAKIFSESGGQNGGAVFIIADSWDVACSALGTLRLEIGKEQKAIDESQDHFLWITDFPLLEYSAEHGRWVACHHPFTMCKDEDQEDLKSGESSKLKSVKAKAYDLVCNGHEIAGGSIRIHNQEIQKSMFQALAMSEEEVQTQFGFFVEALKYGTPPHGGIAWGLDRLAMILCGTDAIRDVIAFPKTAKASCLMSEAPSTVSREQMLELGLKLL